jgi:hypothetical protein
MVGKIAQTSISLGGGILRVSPNSGRNQTSGHNLS